MTFEKQKNTIKVKSTHVLVLGMSLFKIRLVDTVNLKRLHLLVNESFYNILI